MINRILFVCIGNICRSPTAEFLMRSRLASHPYAPTVSSAGISALVGRPVEAKAARLLEDCDIDCSSHKARQLKRELIHNSDLVLTMEKQQTTAILEMFPESRGKIFLLGRWSGNEEIKDPYRKSEQIFTEVFQLIDKNVNIWLQQLR